MFQAIILRVPLIPLKKKTTIFAKFLGRGYGLCLVRTKSFSDPGPFSQLRLQSCILFDSATCLFEISFIANKNPSKEQPGCIRTKPGKIQVHLHPKAQAMQGPQAQGGPMFVTAVRVTPGTPLCWENDVPFQKKKKVENEQHTSTDMSLHSGYESSTASLRTLATLDTNH